MRTVTARSRRYMGNSLTISRLALMHPNQMAEIAIRNITNRCWPDIAALLSTAPKSRPTSRRLRQQNRQVLPVLHQNCEIAPSQYLELTQFLGEVLRSGGPCRAWR